MQQRLITKRVVLHVGYACNLRCRFCYYIDDLNKGRTRNWTTSALKRRLRIARRLGKVAVDLTGGEPSIRKDILEIINYAKSIGYSDINIITNGLKMKDPDFCKQLGQAGLSGVLFSIHSPIEAEHDYLTNVKGSFAYILKALENISQLGIRYRVNSVISNINFRHTDKLFELLYPYSPDAVNLIVFNPSETTISLPNDYDTRIEDYWTISSNMKASLDKYRAKFKTINIRFLPFCLLPGHEDLIRTQWQKMYEDAEWDPFLNISFQKGYFIALGAFIAGLFLYFFHTPKFGKRNIYTLFNEIITTFRVKYYYRQSDACKQCSLRKICTGLPVDYVKRFNKTKLIPYDLGKVIEDPLYFCENSKDRFACLQQS